MELILAKIYIFFVFVILFSISIFLILQIQLRQNLEKNLIRLQKIQDNNSYVDKFKLGQLYLRKSVYTKSIEEFRDCFNLWDKDDRLGIASLFNTIAFTYFRLSEFELAIYYYIIALEIAPDYMTSLTNLLYLYQAENNTEKVDLIYSQILQFDPEYSRISKIKQLLEKKYS